MKKFRWIWITPEIINIENISISEKFFLGLIASLSRKWEIYASNYWFKSVLWFSESKTKRLLKSLEEKNIIEKIGKWKDRKIILKGLNLPPTQWVKLTSDYTKNVPENNKTNPNIHYIYNKNNKNITNFTYTCEYWNIHFANEKCECYKIFGVSYYKFWHFLKENWFRFQNSKEITKNMQLFFKKNYNE